MSEITLAKTSTNDEIAHNGAKKHNLPLYPHRTGFKWTYISIL